MLQNADACYTIYTNVVGYVRIPDERGNLHECSKCGIWVVRRGGGGVNKRIHLNANSSHEILCH